MQSTMRERLLAAAAVRTASVRVGDDTFHVREVSAAKFSKYGELIKSDSGAAMVFLLQECVIDEGGQPCLSVEDAQVVADSARVGMPIITTVLRLSGFIEDKDAPPEKEPDAG